MSVEMNVLQAVTEMVEQYVDERPPRNIHEQQIQRYGVMFLKDLVKWVQEKENPQIPEISKEDLESLKPLGEFRIPSAH